MIPDLFSDAAAAAAAWPTAAAGSTDPAAQDQPADGTFADLLAATIEPQAGGIAPRTIPLPVSLPDAWLGFMTAAPTEIAALGDAADITDDDIADDIADEALEPDSEELFADVTPVAAAPLTPVPIIVQVPTDIMSTMPIAKTVEAEAPVDAPSEEPVAANVTAAPTRTQTPEVPARTSRTEVPESLNDVEAAVARDVVEQKAIRTQADAPPPAAAVRADAAAPSPAAASSAAPSPGAPSRGAPTTPATTVADAVAAPAVPVETAAVGRTAEPSADGGSWTAERAAAPRSARDGQPNAKIAAALRAFEQQAAHSENPAPAPAVPQQAQGAGAAPIAQAVAAASKAAEPAARRDEPFAVDPLLTGVEGVAAAEASEELGDPAKQDTGGQPSNAAPREASPAARGAEATPVIPIAASASTDQALRQVQQTASLLQPFTPAQEAENVTRLVESMRIQWRQGTPEATVRLNPEHLGEVTISIRVDRGGAVTATVHAETPEVQQWLESQQEKLRSGLADQGLNLERFVVYRDRQQQQRDQRQQQAPRYRPQPEAQGQRFEVTV